MYSFLKWLFVDEVKTNDNYKDLNFTLNRLEEELPKTFKNENIPVLSIMIFNELKRALMLYQSILDDESNKDFNNEEFKQKFTILFNDLVSRYQTERDYQFENNKMSQKDLLASMKATSVYFMSAVLNKIKNNEWIIELTNQYPTVFIENGERITV